MANYDIKNPQKPLPQDVIQQKIKEIPERKIQKIENKIKENPKVETPQNVNRPSKKPMGFLSVLNLALVVLLIGALGFIYVSINSRINSLDSKVGNISGSTGSEEEKEKITVLEKAIDDLKKDNKSKFEDLENKISGTEGFASKSDITNIEKILKRVDTDADGLNDYEEVITYDTNPNLKDTDKDGFTDKQEVDKGYNPKGTGKLEKTTEGSTTEEKKTIKLVASDYIFTPNEIEANVGETIRIELSSLDNNYTFTIDELNINQEIKQGAEQVVEITPREAGTYKFYSKNSKDIENNMGGKLIVKAAK